MLVERIEGCNHVHCRCGTGFYYQCGSQYSSDKATGNQIHGTLACMCHLFSVPGEDDDKAVGAAGRQAGKSCCRRAAWQLPGNPLPIARVVRIAETRMMGMRKKTKNRLPEAYAAMHVASSRSL